MRSKRNIKIFVIALFALVVLVASFGVLRVILEVSSVKNSPQPLADGTVLTLVQVDFGKTNLPIDKDILQRFLPKGGLGILGRQLVAPLTAATNIDTARNNDGELVFGIRHMGAITTLPPRGSSANVDLAFKSRVIAFDEFGNEYENNRAFPHIYFSGTLTNPITIWRLGAFPRGGKTVGLRLLRETSTNNWSKIAEFVIPNPDTQMRPRWPGEGTPLTQKIDQVEFTLAELVVNPRESAAYNTNALASFTVKENGDFSDAWIPCELIISDSGGNRCELPIAAARSNSFRFDGRLDPHEPWKIQARFVRVKDIADSDIWQVQNIPISPVGRPIQFSTNFNGHSITFSADARIAAAHTGRVDPNLRIGILSVTDDQNRFAGGSDPVFSQNSLSVMRPIKASADARYLKAEVTIQRSVLAEFVVQPKMAGFSKTDDRKRKD